MQAIDIKTEKFIAMTKW